MSNTVQDLLKPRYKVMGLWPNSGQTKVGDIITIEWDNTGFHFGGATHFGPVVSERKLKEYPHLFKKLEWWEERKPEEMPEYVKCIPYKKGYFEIRKVKRWDGIWAEFDKGIGFEWRVDELEPATKEEYLTYINNQTS